MATRKHSAHLIMADSLLIGTPTIEEESLFHGSLVYISEHRHDEVTTGLIVNKPSDMQLSELLNNTNFSKDADMERFSGQPVYAGGPVNTQRLYVLYLDQKKDSDAEPQLRVTGGELLEDIVAGRGPRQYLVMLGCSMWGKGQLEKEYMENSWVQLPGIASIIFDKHPEERAMLAARHVGFNLNMMHA